VTRAYELKGVAKRYGRVAALSGVAHILEAGVSTAILGPSGSGKTTLIRLLAGLDDPSEGEILLDGAAASSPGAIHVPPHERSIGMVFQDLGLWPNLTAEENVVLGLAGSGLARREAADRARQVLAICGVEELAGRRPGTLSGGQQQRVALARAIAVRPAWLFLDEPFAALDWILKRRLFEELLRIARRQSASLVLVTHDPADARALCERAVVLDEGRIVEAGALADLLRAPRSELLRSFCARE
jgi:ABC-type Fe3+/spermidine/putrescine transport system ATPase subunit